jgi:hypothetical protein
MKPIQLTGLRGNTPIGAMASFGLLRVLSRLANKKATLHFGKAPTFYAQIACEGIATSDNLIECLMHSLVGRSQAWFLHWSSVNDIKVEPHEFRDKAIKPALERYYNGDNEAIEFITAFGSDAVVDGKGNVKPTAFHFTSGQQRFLKSALEAAQTIDKSYRSSTRSTAQSQATSVECTLREGLIGPWRYQAKVHSLGWDPQTEALYALESGSPSGLGARSAPAAVWFAFESLPLFPTVPIVNSLGDVALATTGFAMKGRNAEFRWPIWQSPVLLDDLKVLLPHSIKTSSKYEEHFTAESTIGVTRLFASRCRRDENGRGTFRNAILVN